MTSITGSGRRSCSTSTIRRKRAAEIERHVSLYQACPRLDAVFVPGGDPGANPPDLLLPFLKDIGERLMAQHPEVRVWLSLQWFNRAQIEEVFAYLDKNKPDWLGGLVAGPSSSAIGAERESGSRPKYKLRHYPDITHTVRCQYPVPWDPAFSSDLGLECPIPGPYSTRMFTTGCSPARMAFSLTPIGFTMM